MNTRAEYANSKWDIDQENSEVGFFVRNLVKEPVNGSFKIFNSVIFTPAKDVRFAQINFRIDASSLTTDDVKRDSRLKSRRFLNVKNYSQIAFDSTAIAKRDSDGNYELSGALTIMGESKNVKLNLLFGGFLHDSWGHERAGFTVTGAINLSDWGLFWKSTVKTGGVRTSHEIAIACEIEFVRASQKWMSRQLEQANDNLSILYFNPVLLKAYFSGDSYYPGLRFGSHL